MWISAHEKEKEQSTYIKINLAIKKLMEKLIGYYKNIQTLFHISVAKITIL
jgi:hypothetical protein